MDHTDEYRTAENAATASARGVISRRALITRLATAQRVTQISAPAGSGKTVLLQSWITETDLVDSVAWVPVEGNERDPQCFWISVVDAIRGTTAGSKLMRPPTGAPDVDGRVAVERLLEDLDPLEERLWLVIDDAHELSSGETRRQLELLITRAPPELRFVVATRHDLRLGLHRLRLEGELTEIRAPDLRFTPEEARALLEAAGVALSGPVLARLHEKTEGWAAGLRLAALSLAGHADPERFADQFCGSERTVAEYLLAEVLDRQSEEVRTLLLRTSLLERVNGDLADLLTGDHGGERILQELEQAGAFVVSLDAARSWFGYYRLFADLLQLELRRTAPGEVAALHDAAAWWHAEHGYPIEAIRHAQAARNWALAVRLLFDHWLDLVLAGHGATTHQLLARFPASVVAADTELTALLAADKLARGSLAEAGQHLARARQGLASLPEDRHGRLQVALAAIGLWLARERGDLPAVHGEARRLLACAEDPDTARLGLSEDLRAVALISLGIGELWASRLEDAERHLAQGIAAAQQAGRPYLEIEGLAHSAMIERLRSLGLALERSTQAIELARQHGWHEKPVTAFAYATLGVTLLVQGRLEEAEPWLDHAERAAWAGVHPAMAMMLHAARGTFELARGHGADALAAFRGAKRLVDLVVPQHALTTSITAGTLHALVRLGQTTQADAILTERDGQQCETGEMRILLATLRLAQGDPQAAADALADVLDGSIHVPLACGGVAEAFLLEAIARDALGDATAAGRALEHVLDLAEQDGGLLLFLIHPARALLERHRKSRTAHPVLIGRILNLLAQGKPAEPAGQGALRRPEENGATGRAAIRGGSLARMIPADDNTAPGRDRTLPLTAAIEPLTESEIRILRYLQTHLTAHEIARQLDLSVHTVSTHTRHLYAKLGVHRRHEAVDHARALGLLVPYSRTA